LCCIKQEGRVVTYEPKSMPDYGVVDAVKAGLVPKQYAEHGYFWWKVRSRNRVADIDVGVARAGV
jgi:hypothetical protein